MIGKGSRKAAATLGRHQSSRLTYYADASKSGEGFYEKTIKEETEQYEIDISYPEFYGSGFYNRFINTEIQSVFLGNLFSLKRNLVSWPIKPWHSKTSYGAGFTIKFRREEVLSVISSENWYYSGAAHGGIGVRGINFAGPNFGLITYDVLFKYGENIREQLANIILDNLVNHEQYDAKGGTRSSWLGYVRDTSGPFSNFSLTDEHIEFIFNQYEIASYAEGLFFAAIKWSGIDHLISDEFKATEFYKNMRKKP